MQLTIAAYVPLAAWEIIGVNDRQATPVWTSACLDQRQLEDRNATVLQRLLQLSILAGLARDHYLRFLTGFGVTAPHRAWSLTTVRSECRFQEQVGNASQDGRKVLV